MTWFGTTWARAALLLLLAGAAGCCPAVAAPASTPQARFFALLFTGDSIYAQKAGYQSFARALTYYDRAQALADASHDPRLLAEAALARGRFYDAWNKEPQKTIFYFQQAAALLASVPGQQGRARYARFLVAHAYEKVPDSLRTVQTLRGLRPDLAAYPDPARRRGLLAVEMALTSTAVGNYALADTLLREFLDRPRLLNDPATYDYLTHYYLVQSRLDVHYRHRPASAYLDSLQAATRATPQRLDRLYLSQQLAGLLAAAGRYPAAYGYLRTAVAIGDSLVDGNDLAQTRRALVASEQREQAQAVVARRNRLRLIWGLSAGLAVISLLGLYLARQARRLAAANRALGRSNHDLAAASRAVGRANALLDDKVAQVELLNKEIQHRVKNNLHILFSLLRMQERRTTHPEVLEQLQAARLRVESIATLHTQLMRQPETVSLADFLRTLVSAVVACLAHERQVVTQLQTDTLTLARDNYFPLALILNELITNSVKYADTQGQPLELTVRVTARPEGTHFYYADNGRPAVPPTDPTADPDADPVGLGTQIISLLARQLRATLHQPAPYRYELLIPAPVAADDLLLT